MKFNMKRIASTALAGALALSLIAVPSFASSTTIDGAYQAVTLKVTVPATGKAIINPYSLPIKLGEASISGEQITTGTALTIQNKSSVALDVGAEVTVTIPSGSEAVYASSIAANETGKKFNVNLEIFSDNELAGDVDKEVLNAKFATLKSDDADLVITPTAADAAGKASGGGDGSVMLKEGTADGALQAGGAAYFRLSGNVAKKPTTAWAATDTFSVAIAWTFEPCVIPVTLDQAAVSGRVNTDDLAGAPGTITVTLTGLPEGVTSVSNVVWKSSDETVAKFSAKSSDNGFTAAASGAAATIKADAVYVKDGKVGVTLTFVGSDGVTYQYKSANDAINVG